VSKYKDKKVRDRGHVQQAESPNRRDNASMLRILYKKTKRFF